MHSCIKLNKMSHCHLLSTGEAAEKEIYTV
jgi:hypothetical protein